MFGADGSVLESTWQKRAAGLVKKGRARPAGVDAIILTGANCPNDTTIAKVNINMENEIENAMTQSENAIESDDRSFIRAQVSSMMNILRQTNNNGVTNMVAHPELAARVCELLEKLSDNDELPEAAPEKLDINYILSRIDRIIDSGAQTRGSIIDIAGMNINECPNGGDGDAARAAAIQAAIEARESTNQRIIELLNRMYDDIKPHREYSKAELFAMIAEGAHGGPFSDSTVQLLDKYYSIIDAMGGATAFTN